MRPGTRAHCRRLLDAYEALLAANVHATATAAIDRCLWRRAIHPVLDAARRALARAQATAEAELLRLDRCVLVFAGRLRVLLDVVTDALQSGPDALQSGPVVPFKAHGCCSDGDGDWSHDGGICDIVLHDGGISDGELHNGPHDGSYDGPRDGPYDGPRGPDDGLHGRRRPHGHNGLHDPHGTHSPYGPEATATTLIIDTPPTPSTHELAARLCACLADLYRYRATLAPTATATAAGTRARHYARQAHAHHPTTGAPFIQLAALEALGTCAPTASTRRCFFHLRALVATEGPSARAQENLVRIDRKSVV